MTYIYVIGGSPWTPRSLWFSLTWAPTQTPCERRSMAVSRNWIGRCGVGPPLLYKPTPHAYIYCVLFYFVLFCSILFCSILFCLSILAICIYIYIYTDYFHCHYHRYYYYHYIYICICIYNMYTICVMRLHMHNV